MKAYRLFAMICVLFLLIGCQQNQKRENNMPTNNQGTLESMSSSNRTSDAPEYNDAQLSEIAEYIGTKDELLSQYHTDSVRTLSVIDNKSNNSSAKEVQRIIYCGKTKILILIFDGSGNKVAESFHNMTVTKSAFSDLSVGSLLSEVQVIDPEGEYLFLYTGRNDIPRISMHYTMDGFLISITYDINNAIKNINIESI